MPPNGTGQSLHETATRGIDAITAIVSERDDLRATNDRLGTQLAMIREKNTQLEGRLAATVNERDHYMRHSVELVTRLNNIQTLINSCVVEAGHAAYKPPTVPIPKEKPVLSSDELKQLETLVNRLPRGSEQ